jgi:molybdate transport system substrate-binding protein
MMKIISRCVLCIFLFATVAHAEKISISAAVSLKEAVTDAATAYEAQTGDHIEFTFGASGQLLAQIKNGADVDAFISAANKQVDDLAKAGMVAEGSRRVIARNDLVLIVPGKSDADIKGFEDLSKDSIKKIAVGEPKTVPAGQYAAQVLKKLNLESAVADKIVYGLSVRQVLDYVEQGDVSAGIVYATDAREAGDAVKVIATAKPDWHEAIVYPGVVVKNSAHAAVAKKFLDFLSSDKGQAFLAARGFAPASEAAPTTAPSK